MKPITLGLAMCGSFCTYARVLDAFRAGGYKALCARSDHVAGQL